METIDEERSSETLFADPSAGTPASLLIRAQYLRMFTHDDAIRALVVLQTATLKGRGEGLQVWVNRDTPSRHRGLVSLGRNIRCSVVSPSILSRVQCCLFRTTTELVVIQVGGLGRVRLPSGQILRTGDCQRLPLGAPITLRFDSTRGYELPITIAACDAPGGGANIVPYETKTSA